MQATLEVPGLAASEVTPREFVPHCWEAHRAIRLELEEYLKVVTRSGRGQLFAVHDAAGETLGRIEVEVHPGYTTRGRPCATFGWLDGASPDVVTLLLAEAEAWAARQVIEVDGKLRRNSLLRGPLSFPKNLGGFGCQVEGFDLPRMHSVSTNRSELAAWVEAAGFKPDAPYACVDVSAAPEWASATLPEEFQIVYWDHEEWLAREPEVRSLIAQSFAGFLPDSSGPERLFQVLDTMDYYPEGRFINPVAIAPDGSLAAFILCTPNLYDAWDGRPVTGANVDTVVVAPPYRRLGLMSVLNNNGRVQTLEHLGWTHLEGTTIWFANEKAVQSIFPHGRVCRKHVVFQKRIVFRKEKEVE